MRNKKSLFRNASDQRSNRLVIPLLILLTCLEIDTMIWILDDKLNIFVIKKITRITYITSITNITNISNINNMIYIKNIKIKTKYVTNITKIIIITNIPDNINNTKNINNITKEKQRDE